MKKIGLLLFLTIALFSCKEEHKNLKDGLYAEIITSKGTILLDLNYQKAPVTVANFVTLAEGKNTFVNGDRKGKPFFDGLLFHRVIPNFMIQGGDPDGTGAGGTGYSFKDEFCDLKFDKEGILAMANSGPATNSSQFFITHVPTPWLDNKHTIFGQVIENGIEVVNKIVTNDVISRVSIIRVGESAKKFDAVKVFSDYFASETQLKKSNTENAKISQTEKVNYFKSLKAKAIKTSSGLSYCIIQKGTGKKPNNGATVYVDYAGFLEDGTLFDTSMESAAKENGKFDQGRADAHQYLPFECIAGNYPFIPGFNEGVSKMNFGDKWVLFIPANLGYGEAGAGNVIPPNANIIFEVQLKENK
ncbi:peptidylprolyl isomerase [Flavobacterium branchiophilum]|uniref:peptidylprolyl isomerase n=1 Tax=Flavobacterium branchiophilum (strain FL-15) TaxID=1034807 RepID=G2Z1P3_FLABF|nr:peptidylprolyl isomerase [Flavobacterium branchiophilum]CCB69821.1 Probable peptidyl-prolyl cis-trans isomerase precursor PpiA [Flavobacterium branchiophilum FL-15]